MIDEVQFKTLTINGYGNILVGSDGSIIAKKGKMTPNATNSKGYLRVHIGNRHYAVHRLVALAFIDNPENLPQVNHKDGDKHNNSVSNLEWCTNVENKRHAVQNNLISSKVSPDDARSIRSMYTTGKYTYADIGALYGLSYSMVGYIVRGDSWRI